MFGKFCLRVFVGIALFVLFGGKDAVGMLVMSVVCTMGLGLIWVIPAAYLLGLVCTIWFIPFGRKPEKPEWKNPSERTSAQASGPGRLHSLAELESLRAFIEAADTKGQDWNTIRTDLLNAGWDARTVEQARLHAGIVGSIVR